MNAALKESPVPLALAAPEADALLARARTGDLEAFVAFAEPHLPRLRRLLRPLAGGADRTDDLVSQTVLRAFGNLHQYEDRRFGTWLHRVGVNLAVSMRRREAVERRVLEELPHRHQRPGPWAAEDPALSVLKREQCELLSHALQGLPERHREALILRFQGDLSCQDIAERMDTTANAVSLMIHRGKKRLKGMLAAAS